MYDCLKKGGRIVTLCSKHYQNCNNKTETQFREWLIKINADIQEVPAGEFKESGTNISCVMIIINK